MDKFEFDIRHGSVSYHCFTTCIKQGLDYLYLVDLKAAGTTGEGTRIAIRQVHSDCADWIFTFENGENAGDYYPPTLLEQLGEEIEEHNFRFIV